MLEHIDFSSLENTTNTSCQRLFHGRGHAYPDLSHINIDWLSPVILITLYDEVDTDWLKKIALQLSSLIPECLSVQVQYRCRSRSPFEIIAGKNIIDTVVTENNLKYSTGKISKYRTISGY